MTDLNADRLERPDPSPEEVERLRALTELQAGRCPSCLMAIYLCAGPHNGQPGERWHCRSTSAHNWLTDGRPAR